MILWGGEFALEVPHVPADNRPALQPRQTDLSERPDRCLNGRIIEPLIPPGKFGGGKRRVAIREVMQRRDVHSCEHRLPVARAAQGFAAQKHRA